MFRKIVLNRKILYKVIIILEIVIILVLFLLKPKEKDKKGLIAPLDQEHKTYGSIFDVLPYEGDSFSVYYYTESDTFSILIRDLPYDESLNFALEFLHNYEETKDSTEEDVRIVTPAHFNPENLEE